MGFEGLDKAVPNVVLVIVDWVETVKPDSHIVSPSVDSRPFDVSESNGHFSEG